MTVPVLASAAAPDEPALAHLREVYLVYVSGTDPDNVRVLLEDEIRSRHYNVTVKMHMIVAEELNPCTSGDVLVLPNMTKYCGLNQLNMKEFLEDALEESNKWKGVKQKLSGFCILAHLYDDTCKIALAENKEALDMNLNVASCTNWETKDKFLVFNSKDPHGNEKKLPNQEADSSKKKSQNVDPVTLYICYGTVDSWPHLTDQHEELPVILAKCVRKADLKVTMNVFDKGNSDEFTYGDVITFPDRKIYRGLTPVTAQDFVQTILVNGQKDNWFQIDNLGQKSLIFVCCEQTTTGRVCSVCGPLVLERFCQEVVSLELQQRVSCYACSHPRDVHAFSSEVILYTYNDGTFWFKGLEPRAARTVLCQHFLNLVVPSEPGHPFSMFWGSFIAAVDTNGYIRKLLDTLGHFIFQNVISLGVRNQRVKDSLLTIQNHIEQVEKLVTLCDERAMEAEVDFAYIDILSREVNCMLCFIYKIVNEIKKEMAERLLFSVLGPTAVFIDVKDLANAARGLLHQADDVRRLIVDLGRTPQREESDLRQPVSDIPIYP